MADAKKASSDSLSGQVTELKDLVLAYAKQETVDPLKALGRFVKFGVPGAVLLCLGLTLLLIGGMRALRIELAPHLDGNLSFLPYAAGILIGLLVIGLLVRGIFKEQRKAKH